MLHVLLRLLHMLCHLLQGLHMALARDECAFRLPLPTHQLQQALAQPV